MVTPVLYQCIPAYKPVATGRLVSWLFKNHCKVLLDIEDSIQEMGNWEQTTFLKGNARVAFKELLKQFPHHKFSIRINAVQTADFAKDILLLQECASQIESVFLPKVVHQHCIAAFYAAVKIPFRLNLIVETAKGIKGLPDLLESEFKGCIDHVFFGNYDYHLDIGCYPIQEQHTPAYWQLVSNFIRITEKRECCFGNSPYAYIADTQTLEYACTKLQALCKRNFALISLHKSQTIHLIASIKNEFLLQTSLPDNTLSSFSRTAFTNRRQKGRSFSFDNHRITTPQEYILLLKHKNA